MTNRTISTIGYGLDIMIEFDHHPGRDAKMFGDDAHPEEPAELEITKIWAELDHEMHDIKDSLSTEEMRLNEGICWRKVADDARAAAEDCPDG